MDEPMIGLDWAASGLKIAVTYDGETHLDRLPWKDESPEPPPVGVADREPLAAYVRRHRLKGQVARVAVQRRDVLMVSFQSADNDEAARALPLSLSGWRWRLAPFDGQSPVIIGIEETRARALKAFVESAGLRLGAVVLPLDPHGSGVVTLDVGLNEARIASRGMTGALQLQRRRRNIEDILVGLGSHPVSTLHLTGGGSMEMDLANVFRARIGCEVVPPASRDDAIFRGARVAAEGSGLELWNPHNSEGRRRSAWPRAAAVAAFSLAFGSSAALGWVERSVKSRAPVFAPLRLPEMSTSPRAATVLGRALNAIPAGVRLAHLDLDLETQALAMEGVAASYDTVASLVASLAAASFQRPRCVSAVLDESRRVRFRVVANNDR